MIHDEACKTDFQEAWPFNGKMSLLPSPQYQREHERKSSQKFPTNILKLSLQTLFLSTLSKILIDTGPNLPRYEWIPD